MVVQLLTTAVLGVGPTAVKTPDFGFFELKEEIEEARNPIILKMVGNMLPFVPFEFGGEQKLTEKFYPGNPVPSVQVLGSREAELVVKGRLHDRRQAQGSQIAWNVQRVLDEIRKRGNMIRISLGDEWVRWGFLRATKFPMRDKNSIEYQLTFFIISDTKPEQNPIVSTRKTLPRDITNDLKLINASIQDNLLDYPDGYPKDIFDTINDLVSGVAAQVKVVTDAVDNIISLGEKTSAVLNRAVALVASARSQAFRASRRIGVLSLDQNIRQATLKESMDYGGITQSYSGVTRQSVTSGYRAVSATLTTQRQVDQAQVLLQALSDEIRAYIDSISRTRHLVKDGETLQTIAIKYYGSVDGWQKIHTHNKLTAVDLEAGTVLEIPK